MILFAYGHQAFSAIFVEKDLSFPPLNGHYSLLENNPTIYERVYFWAVADWLFTHLLFSVAAEPAVISFSRGHTSSLTGLPRVVTSRVAQGDRRISWNVNYFF